ncbi:MAG: NAD(P)H-dependent oxidoreductase [Alphaproteobacteria bacterium]|nr:NAD(P)H-dependent oxidoreductase [Alphaproteobacteria bacterium]MBU1512639.1 NAD(P)H-dependent oxidoreductase [Alphaproteobacteria bacterium]MBU2095033.1 NAD(P)H-dependent oxidoreductase [Alphaproteobacteria bacterium]MBU2151848.1 NAD(P)H-dependent oxidoreductase [Alphaproteobacteria bacterium]MBU2306247.1 NAD(P)H-dependent oxidoreductase [Alphaproteobacteria bacterium]
MNLLHIDSSILGDHSVSRQISAAAVAALRAATPGLKVTYRDLDATPAPHQSGALMAARATPAETRTAAQARDVADADAILEDFLAADVVVIGVPMYNFGIPSQLKSWIDHLAVAGRTFSYSAAGVQGLAGGKRVILASSRGGFYGADSPAAGLQHQESYLRGFLGFIGVTDIEVIGAEGVNVSPDLKQSATDAAVAQAGGLSAIRQAA